jgi:hypothetical protein
MIYDKWTMDSTVSWIFVSMAAIGETFTSLWETHGCPCPPHPCLGATGEIGG